MKKIFAILLISLAVIPKAWEFELSNNLTSGMNPYDHIVVSTVLTLTFSYILSDAGEKYGLNLLKPGWFRSLLSSLLTISLTFFKEKIMDHYFQQPDMNANYVGVCCGVVTLNLINLFQRSQR